MPLPFDATLKDLVREYPADWVSALLAPPQEKSVRLVAPDLSTVTAFADVVLMVGEEYLLHADFQTGPDANLPRRVLLYNVLLYHHFGLPVHSVVVLLRPRADRGDLTGRVRYEVRSGRGALDFTFEVVRIWERPVESLLEGGLGTLPLAPLGRLPEGVAPEQGLAAVVARMAERVTVEAPPPVAAHLLTAAFVLTGLRVPTAEALQLFQGVRAMRDSSTYQYILDEGRAEGLADGERREARKIVLRQGRLLFGAPTAADEAALQAITDLERLERISEHVLSAAGWQDLLAVP